MFPTLEPLRYKTIDNVWKWLRQRDYRYDRMPVVTSRRSLEKEKKKKEREKWECKTESLWEKMLRMTLSMEQRSENGWQEMKDSDMTCLKKKVQELERTKDEERSKRGMRSVINWLKHNMETKETASFPQLDNSVEKQEGGRWMRVRAGEISSGNIMTMKQSHSLMYERKEHELCVLNASKQKEEKKRLEHFWGFLLPRLPLQDIGGKSRCWDRKCNLEQARGS